MIKGNEIIVEFQIVVYAARSAAKVHRAVFENNADPPERQQITIQVGRDNVDVIFSLV